MQYNALASIQWIPLYLLALIVLLRGGTKRSAVLAGAAFALVALTSYYYAWFVVWFTALVVVFFAAAAAIRLRRDGRSLGPAARRVHPPGRLARRDRGGTALVLPVPFLLVSARSAAEEAGNRASDHGGRALFGPPVDALRPAPRQSHRGRAGAALGARSTSSNRRSTSKSIYLGYTVLVLALVALWGGRRRALELAERARFARGPLVAGTVAGGMIMIGPYIPLDWGYGYWRNWQDLDATARIPSLGWLMYEIGPVFRFFTRAFVLVSACLALLAAIGFSRLERLRWMTPGRRVSLAAVVVGLVGLEFTNAPPHVWVPDREPPWVEAVRNLPAGSTVADYPVAAAFSPRSLYYMFWQTKHRRRTLNPPERPEAAALAAAIGSADDPATGVALRRAGIDYAVVHTLLPPQTRPPYQPELPNDSMPPDVGALNPWFRLHARTRDAVIYRVLSTPRRASGAVARPTSGFGAVEPEGEGRARWLEAPRGTLTLFVTGRQRALQLVLTVSSFAQPRRVSVRFDGRLVDAFRAAPGRYVTRPIPLGAPAPGKHVVELETQPGPQSISAVTGTPDERSVSLRLREAVTVALAQPERR